MKSWQTSSIPGPERVRGILLALGAAVLLCGAASLCLGPVSLSLSSVLSALTGGGDETARRIVLLARLPRTCGCLLAGWALAVSGAVIQSVLDNPLAAPNVIGVNAGAGFGVALCAAFGTRTAGLVPLAAFLGALAGVMLVLGISSRAGASRMTLVLAGVAISSMFSAGIDAVLTFVPDALNGYTDFRIGGLQNLSMERLGGVFWGILAASLVLLWMAGDMDVLRLGAESAHSLGLPVASRRLLFLTLAAALAGFAVSFAGLLGFVGLIVPHMTRRLVGEESAGALLLATALGGAAFLTLADLLSRMLFRPFELPVGVTLALVGGPFFLWLLLRQRGGRSHG